MSEFEREVSEEAHDAFSEPATLNGNPVEVVINRSLEFVDEGGNVVDRMIGVDFLRSELPAWSRGDVLTTEAGEVFVLQKRVSDDGFVVTVSAMLRGEVVTTG